MSSRCHSAAGAAEFPEGNYKQLGTQLEAEFPLPDLALILQVAPERGLERVETRGSAAEPAFEELDFLRRVASTFDEIDRDYIVRVDGDDEPDRVHERVLSLLAERPGLRL